MKAKHLLEYLETQSERSEATLFEKEVVVRVGGREYAIRRVDASTSAIVLEGGEELIQEDTLPGRGDVPSGPEGEGIEPPPPE
jgi:hypothetical protein